MSEPPTRTFTKYRVQPMQLFNIAIFSIHLYAYYIFNQMITKYDSLGLETQCKTTTYNMRVLFNLHNTTMVMLNFWVFTILSKRFSLYQLFVDPQINRNRAWEIFNQYWNSSTMDGIVEFLAVLFGSAFPISWVATNVLIGTDGFTPCFINHLTNEYYVCSILIIMFNTIFVINFISCYYYSWMHIFSKNLESMMEIVDVYYFLSKIFTNITKRRTYFLCGLLTFAITHMYALYTFHSDNDGENNTIVNIMFWVGFVVDGANIFVMCYNNSSHATHEYINLTLLGTIVNITCLIIGCVDNKIRPSLENSMSYLFCTNVFPIVYLMIFSYGVGKIIYWSLMGLFVGLIVLVKITCVFVVNSICSGISVEAGLGPYPNPYSKYCDEYGTFLRTGYYFTKEHIIADSGVGAGTSIVIDTNGINQAMLTQGHPQPIVYGESGV